MPDQVNLRSRNDPAFFWLRSEREESSIPLISIIQLGTFSLEIPVAPSILPKAMMESIEKERLMIELYYIKAM
jgi:hypothetical protein